MLFFILHINEPLNIIPKTPAKISTNKGINDLNSRNSENLITTAFIMPRQRQLSNEETNDAVGEKRVRPEWH